MGRAEGELDPGLWTRHSAQAVVGHIPPDCNEGQGAGAGPSLVLLPSLRVTQSQAATAHGQGPTAAPKGRTEHWESVMAQKALTSKP